MFAIIPAVALLAFSVVIIDASLSSGLEDDRLAVINKLEVDAPVKSDLVNTAREVQRLSAPPNPILDLA